MTHDDGKRIYEMTDNTRDDKEAKRAIPDDDVLDADEIEERAEKIAQGLFSSVRKPFSDYRRKDR